MPRIKGSGKPYRFRTRKLKSGEIIYVLFRAMPGKWISTGTCDPDEAETWAANYEVTVHEEISSETTLKEFTKNFYIPGRCPWLRRMQAKGQTFSALHIKRMWSCLDNYILPGFGNLILPAIRQGAIDDYLLDLKSTRDGRSPYMDLLSPRRLILIRKRS